MSGGLLYEQKHNEQIGKYTCFTISKTQLICGTKNGTTVHFNLLNGQFIKQIPFQIKLLKPFFVDYHLQKPKPVHGIIVNSADNMLSVFEDNSVILLDQNSKQILKYHLGLRYPITYLKQLPLTYSDVQFGALSENDQLIMLAKNELA